MGNEIRKKEKQVGTTKQGLNEYCKIPGHCLGNSKASANDQNRNSFIYPPLVHSVILHAEGTNAGEKRFLDAKKSSRRSTHYNSSFRRSTIRN